MSKAEILKKVIKNQPAAISLPDLSNFRKSNPATETDLVETFIRSAEVNKTRILRGNASDLEAFLQKEHGAATIIRDNDYPGHNRSGQIKVPDVVVIRAQLGVAENGALWLTEQEMKNRLLPFIAEHLILTLPSDQIVATMHDAYATIQIDATGFGVFIAGPSKTADIEQSLVIGAQGPRSLTVLLSSK